MTAPWPTCVTSSMTFSGRSHMERHADEIDRAASIAEEHNQDCVDHYRRLAAPQQERNPDGSWPTTECVDCAEDIEAERLEAGRVRCFECRPNSNAGGVSML